MQHATHASTPLSPLDSGFAPLLSLFPILTLYTYPNTHRNINNITIEVQDTSSDSISLYLLLRSVSVVVAVDTLVDKQNVNTLANSLIDASTSHWSTFALEYSTCSICGGSGCFICLLVVCYGLCWVIKERGVVLNGAMTRVPLISNFY